MAEDASRPLRSTEIQIQVRASPTSSPQQILNAILSQLQPYLEAVVSQYQIVYRIRVRVEPVFVKVPAPVATTIPAREEEAEAGEELE